VASSARYYLGLVETRLGKFAHARELLMPFLPRAGSAGPGDEALVELRGALAEATAGVGDLPAAVEIWDAYDRGARPHEKAYARQKAARSRRRWRPRSRGARTRAPEGGSRARAAEGRDLRTQGDATGAAFIDGESTDAARPGNRGRRARIGPGDPARVGWPCPTGKFQPVGEAPPCPATGTPARGQTRRPCNWPCATRRWTAARGAQAVR
jgi:hypothetical protein